MNALEAKARQESAAALVEGDPIGRRGSPPGPLDLVLKGAATVRLSELAAALGGIDTNRVAHHLFARGYAPSEGDNDVYERHPWHALPWPAPAAEVKAQPPSREFTFGSAISGGGGKLGSAVSGGGDVLACARVTRKKSDL